MKAMILAAGFGTRLFPLTIDRTKPAIPFLGKPLVGYVAEYVAKFGIKDFVVNLHHQPDSVIDALGDGDQFGVHIEYTREVPKILGTAGALDNARQFLEDSTFIIVNGKIITDIDIAAAIEAHKRSGAIATMILKPNSKRERFTIVGTADGWVTGFGDYATPVSGQEIKDVEHEIVTPLMFTGIHILEPRVFDYIPRGVYSDIVPTFYNPALAAGEKIATYVTDANWFELSTIPRYLDISLSMMGSGDVHFGRNCVMAGAASLKDSVLWDDVTIGDGATLYRTIVADGVTIEPGEHFENAAIVRADMVRNCTEIPEKAMKGYVQGENYIVPLN
ncbi:MAG TPA: NDP-sugar synthase [Pyrinomonadaceae bacterium]|nr:NDP-sugar synthase [Chloracidobacterium sp.]MBP9935988.1 NDP-sugar synthase [Pyrinomonadaceae bacterium]MBK7803901.1 NDP-sugar synthase [Chloracidobacterium sp.]MBK9439428.1 NDP-sugar synthase [Chloracidobacterium sp.]MBK9768268.1 NDP-sugar synthase [Chloracidobacterium sp.]